ncbi:MAG: hypothetical protein IKD94_03265 [Erysipelotrichaceae bacterium]|nr:hypothetical protein [Erysipelotrichaceae bacterium]
MPREEDFISPDELEEWLQAQKDSKEEENEKQNLALIEEIEVDESTVHFSRYPAEKVRIISHDSSNCVLFRAQTSTGFIEKDVRGKNYHFEKADVKKIKSSYTIKCKRIEMVTSQNRLIPLRPLDKIWLDEFLEKKGSGFRQALADASRELSWDIKVRTGARGKMIAFIHRFIYQIDPSRNFFNVLIEWSPARERNAKDYHPGKKKEDPFTRYITYMNVEKELDSISLIGNDSATYKFDTGTVYTLRFYPINLDESNNKFRLYSGCFVRPFRKIVPEAIRENIDAFKSCIIKTKDGYTYSLTIDRNRDRRITEVNKQRKTDDDKYFEIVFEFEV